MGSIVPLFKDVSKIAVPAPYRLRENSKSDFAICIQEKINSFNCKFDYSEMRILGGIPDLSCAGPLAEVLFVFLENQLGGKRRGQVPDEGMMQKLVAAASAEQILYDPKFRLCNANRELSRFSKVLLATTLDRLLKYDRYKDFRTDPVYQGIAETLYGQGRDLALFANGIGENNPDFEVEMRAFYRSVLGHLALSMAEIPETIDYHLAGKFSPRPDPRPGDRFSPANDWN